MAVDTLEERVQRLESKIQAVEDQLAEQGRYASPEKRGWRWFVGIYADSPDFEEVQRVGQEWRNADRPRESGNSGT